MLDEIGGRENIRRWLEAKLTAGERLMGFGHRVYNTEDPRATHLRKMSKELGQKAGNTKWFEMSERIEALVKAEKKLFPNVDFYSGVILSAIGFPTEMFTVLFALARTVGWVAQWNEMIADPEQKIGRPRQLYTGATRRDYVPVERR